MGKIKLLIKYSGYRMRRKGARGHGIHPPFVYRFNRDILNCSKKHPEYKEIREFRNILLKNRELIKVDDHGAGSDIFSSDNRRVRDIARYSSSSYRIGRLLFRLARHLQPGTVLELGTSIGFGTFCLAKGAGGGKVYSLEACGAQIRTALTGLGNAGIGNVELIKGNFRDSLPELLARIDRVDLVYFDGDHRKEEVLWQFSRCLEKVVPGTVFVAGDIHWSDDMREAWRLLCKDPAVTLSVDLFDCGLLFFRKGVSKQHFILGFK
jgi:predicted O-methyltransferase YrrM